MELMIRRHRYLLQRSSNSTKPCLNSTWIWKVLYCVAISHWSRGFLTNEEYSNISLKADEPLSVIGREKRSRVLSWYRQNAQFGLVELTYFHHYLEIVGVHEEKLQNESQSGPICLLFPFLVILTLYYFFVFPDHW